MFKPTLIATAAIAAAALVPASASATGLGGFLAPAETGLPKPADAQFKVPAGKVEHRISIVTVSGTKALASKERQELWLSATRSRMVVTDLTTGKLRVEIVDRPGETRIYDAKKRKLTISRTKSTTPPYTSSAYEAALQRAYVERGIMKVTGERTVDGRRLLTLASVDGKWKSSDPGSRAVALVDAGSYQVQEIESILDGGLFSQKVEHRVTETLDAGKATSAKLAMRSHAGAKVTRTGK